MSVELESQLEMALVESLTNMKYERIHVTNAREVAANFRKMLHAHNPHVKPLTDSEFERFLKSIGNKGVFDSAQILRSKQVLVRDDGTEVYLELLNTRKWCDNQFQVAHQIQDERVHKGRYDVTLFINGLPLVQIELKRRGIDYKEAFNQIARYKLHNFGGLFGFVQVFVVSNGGTTKYFANRDGALDFAQTFYWTDKENKRISNLHEFTQDFLRPCQVSKLISRFMILNKSTKSLMVMRPYQTYAVEALIDQATNTGGGGYVWHTTGSGKTMTSFKAAQILANEPGIDRVFFLVDRTDLDSQTLEEFNKFQAGTIDTTDKTATLVKQINTGQKLILTTIQKMSRAVKQERYAHAMQNVKNERVVFIIDECHRTQFGDMHNAVKAYFTKAQYFGFTGTPIFPLNKSGDGRTTADIFGKLLHSYLIKNAIHDGNVLGFSVSYFDTIKERENLPPEMVQAIDTQSAMESVERISMVTKHILMNHHQLTRNKTYTAMLAVDSIPGLIDYYKAFKREDYDLNVAAVFTYDPNEDLEGKAQHSKDAMLSIMQDYNETFKTNYGLDVYDSYQKNVAEKVKSTEIDLLIVVDKFLTGFDSKMLNTLYVDKNLKNHGLIQAFSRTNRVAGSTKPFGNIVCYRRIKDQVDAAICLYSDVDVAEEVLMDSYDAYVEIFTESMHALLAIAPTVASVDLLIDEDDQKEFVRAFRDVGKAVRNLENFTAFDRGDSLRQAGLTENDFADYQGKFMELYRKRQSNPKASILGDIDFQIEFFTEDKINVNYILGLLRTIDLSDPNEVTETIKKVERALSQATGPELVLKAELIRQFIRDILPGLDSGSEVPASYGAFEEAERMRELDAFASDHFVTPEQVLDFTRELEFTGTIPYALIRGSFVAPNYAAKKKATNEIIAFVQDYVAKYA